MFILGPVRLITIEERWTGVFVSKVKWIVLLLSESFYYKKNLYHSCDYHQVSNQTATTMCHRKPFPPFPGFFGFVVLSLLLIPMYFIHVGDFSNNPRHVLEDALDAFCQIGHQPLILLALLGNTVSIAFFNFAGISVTKEISATTRMVLDSLRTLVIWAVSLALRWEQFQGLQVLGFVVLLLGTALYNGLHRPLLAKIPCCAGMVNLSEEDSPGERERLLSDGRVQADDNS